MAEIAKKLGVCTSAIAKAIQKKEGEEKEAGLTFLISRKADFSSSIFLDRWLSNVKLSSLTPNTVSIERAAIRQDSPGVFVLPPGVSWASFGVCFEASIEQQEDSRFLALPTNPTGVFPL